MLMRSTQTATAQVFTIVPMEIKERLIALKQIDKAVYSETRVIRKCINLALSTVEQEAKSSFNEPIQETPSPRRRRR